MNFRNTSGSLPIAALVSPGALSFDALDWKPAAQIQQMLANWHDLQADLHASWFAIPAEARARMVMPEGAGAYALAREEEQSRSNSRRAQV